MKKKIVFYEDEENHRPVEEFLDELDSKTRKKVGARIALLGNHWAELRRPYVDFLQNGLYELRVVLFGKQVRVIYAYMFKDYIVLLHGFNKSTDDVQQEDMLKAKYRMMDFQKRVNHGLINLSKLEEG